LCEEPSATVADETVVGAIEVVVLPPQVIGVEVVADVDEDEDEEQEEDND
jgi:hypothetical protein